MTDKLEELTEKLGGAGRALELDVTNASSVQRLISRLPEDWRRIDILVNNAGHDEGGRRRLAQGSAHQWPTIAVQQEREIQASKSTQNGSACAASERRAFAS